MGGTQRNDDTNPQPVDDAVGAPPPASTPDPPSPAPAPKPEAAHPPAQDVATSSPANAASAPSPDTAAGGSAPAAPPQAPAGVASQAEDDRSEPRQGAADALPSAPPQAPAPPARAAAVAAPEASAGAASRVEEASSAVPAASAAGGAASGSPEPASAALPQADAGARTAGTAEDESTGAAPAGGAGVAGRWVRGYARTSTWRVAGTAAVVGLALAAGGIAAGAPWHDGQRSAERAAARDGGGAADGSGQARADAGPRPLPEQPSWQPAAPVLAPVTWPSASASAGASVGAAAADPSSSAAPGTAVPTPAGMAAALHGALTAPGLGRITASVVDVATGRSLFASGAAQPLTPASTNKLATATTVLTLLGDDHRFTTRTVQTSPGHVVLVGGGDPTLSAAGLAQLAADTAAALHAQAASGTGAPKVRLGYDISAFSGPALSPIGVNDNIALIQALTVDEGRIDPHSTEDAPRYHDPAAQAAADFAADLAKHGVTVTGTPQQTTLPTAATPAPAPLASHDSPPLSDIVERMLTESDNDIADTLGHQAAIAAGKPATYSGGAAAVLQTLRGLGIRLGGATLADNSGLSGRDALPADVLTQILALDASPDHPQLRPILSGLPIAGFSGTEATRSEGGGPAAAGLGVVRAKTGSLSGVNTLAGLVVDADGRLLAFAFMSNDSADAATARNGLDVLAGRVAACGCR